MGRILYGFQQAGAGQCCRSSSLSAQALLLWQRAMTAFCRRASPVAHSTILWDTVLVNRIIRSGEPIFRRKSAGILANTLARQPWLLQMSLYCRSILSFPPTMTTLMEKLLSDHGG